MVAVGTNVTITEYNDYVLRLNAILGIGTGTSGYGVAMTGPGQAVAGTTEISAAQWDGLRTDINLIYAHQLNSTTSVGQLVSGNIIGADVSNTGTGNTVIRDDATNTFTIVNPANNKGINDFSGILETIEANPRTVYAPNLSLESKIVPSTSGASYTSSWQSLSAIVQVTFAGGYNCKNNAGATVTATTDDHRRHFFNTGGEIRFSSEMTNGSGTKAADWTTMLVNAGTISFKNSATTTTGSATVGSGFGSEDLTTSYQQIAIKYGSDALYAENNFSINAKIDGSGNILFQFVWTDSDSGDPYTDESVNGDVSITMSQIRCTTPITILNPGYTISQNIQ
jgi:hypothetical protein|tara:strand:- start:902 stop:1918 length:1017 start_codon:yes stop_codon:yes gene_type:complete